MMFNSKKDLIYFLKRMKELGSGATSFTYYDNKNELVYKISSQLFNDCYGIDKYDLNTFNNITNDTYVFPKEIIYINDTPTGFILDYVDGQMLYNIDPLKVNLDMYIKASEKAMSDTIKLSNDGIKSIDVVFNTMLSNDRIKVIDTDSYERKDNSLSTNISNINNVLKDFLIASNFEEFIESNKVLSDMYDDRQSNIKEFLITFRNSLNEYLDTNIETLSEAKKALNKTNRFPMYIRSM